MSRAPQRPEPDPGAARADRGSSRSSSSATRISVVPAGGSSSVLSSADWASSFMRCASRMIATRATPSTGSSDSSVTRSRTPRLPSLPPIRPGRPGPRARGDGGRGGCRARPCGSRGMTGTAGRRRSRRAQESGREVQREGGLAHRRGPREEHRVGDVAASIARTAPIAAGWPTCGSRPRAWRPVTSGVSPRSGVASAAGAALRVVRRLARPRSARPRSTLRRPACASCGARGPEPPSRRLATASGASSPVRPPRLRVVVRRLGAGASVASLAAASARRRSGGRRLLRVVRRFGAASAVPRRRRQRPRRAVAAGGDARPGWTTGASTPASRPVPRRRALGHRRGPPAGTSPSARGASSSSSGGTSLHGSALPDGAACRGARS